MTSTVAPKGLLHWLRMALAVLLPAAVGGFVGSLILSFNLLSDVLAKPGDEEEVFGISRTGLMFIGTFMGGTWGQFATLIVGLPAHTWLKHTTRRRAWMYALAGVCAGFFFGVLFVWPMMFGMTLPLVELGWLGLASTTAGAAAGLTFWLIRRPDRDAPIQPQK